MSQILNAESPKKAPPKPPRLSKNMEIYPQLQIVTEGINADTGESLNNTNSDLNFNTIFHNNESIKENGISNETTENLDNSKEIKCVDKENEFKEKDEIPNNSLEENEAKQNSLDILSDSNATVKNEVPKHLPLRSISTPDGRVQEKLELSERPRTYNNNADKSDNGSPRSRTRRKESFLKNVVNVFKKRNDPHSNEIPHKTMNVNKPCLVSGNFESFKGTLFKMVDSDFKLRWCFLRTDFFLFYLDSEFKDVEESFSLNSIISVQLIEEHKYNFKVDGSTLFYFELRAETGRYVFGCKSEEERKSWMTKFAESLNHKLISRTKEYKRIGWLYIKEGINGTWFGAWSLLMNRSLYYTIDNNEIHMIDLRKTRCVNLQETAEGECMPRVFEEGPHMLIDCQKACFYFQNLNLYETEAWYKVIRKANTNGSYLEEQQLYTYDVPVIVEKCINFIYLHGSLLTGIYRRTGNLSKSEEIVSQFKADAWTTHLPSDVYTGYDVARAFKKFFSDLSEPIITRNSQGELHQIFKDSSEEERAGRYQTVFEKYSSVNYNTLRMLVRHLHFIVEYKDKNLMTSENVASVWAVTMMHSEVNNDAHFISRDTELVTDLINLSGKIFPESEKERHHEALVRKTWEDHIMNAKRPINGNFRIWIYYCNKEGESYNIEIGLYKTAQEVCQELSTKVNMPANKLILEEVILNDHLIRPIHYDEKVLDVILKWAYWQEADRKDNCLILSPLDKYEAFLMDNMLPAMDELKFADRTAKHFQMFTLELSCGYLNCFKDANKTQIAKTWDINEIEWYIGNEKNRNTPTKHTLTFIEKCEQKRYETAAWFGNVISFTSEFSRNAWISSLWKEGHKKEFLPLAMEFLMKRCQANQK